MNKIQKRLLILVSILTVISLTINITLLLSFYVTPDKLTINSYTLKSELIPASLDEVTIVYFTDLQYGEFQNDERCDQLFSEIENLNPDILLFGGDLYDKSYAFTDDTNNKLTQYLSNIDAPLGKFALYGENDIASETYQNAINSIFSKSEFEIIRNSSVKITNQKNEYINLFGFDIDANVENINKLSSKTSFDILLTHYPDHLVKDDLMDENIDFAIAGHSHDSQITFPLYGSYKEVKGSKKMNRNNRQKLSFEYILSSGVGCTGINARLGSTPEILYIILKSDK
ncbi:MAG: metallophosphoesterase [Holdemanella sp.]|nr:metallophosphoesterase [Holdemanella sp.]